jgi:hypothetical protein
MIVNDYSDEFFRTELVRTTGYYKDKNGHDKFDKRARAGIVGGMGLLPSYLDSIAPGGSPHYESPNVTKPWLGYD